MSDIPSNSIEKKYLLPTIISLNSRGILAKSHPQWIETGESSLESVQASLVTKFSKVGNSHLQKATDHKYFTLNF